MALIILTAACSSPKNKNPHIEIRTQAGDIETMPDEDQSFDPPVKISDIVRL